MKFIYFKTEDMIIQAFQQALSLNNTKGITPIFDDIVQGFFLSLVNC